MADTNTVADQIEAMRRNLRLAAGHRTEVWTDSAALDIAAKIAVCVIAEDVRAIREAITGGAS